MQKTTTNFSIIFVFISFSWKKKKQQQLKYHKWSFLSLRGELFVKILKQCFLYHF